MVCHNKYGETGRMGVPQEVWGDKKNVVCHREYGEIIRMRCAERSMRKQAGCGVPQGKWETGRMCGVPQEVWGDRQKVVCDKEHGEKDRMWCVTRKMGTGRI